MATATASSWKRQSERPVDLYSGSELNTKGYARFGGGCKMSEEVSPLRPSRTTLKFTPGRMYEGYLQLTETRPDGTQSTTTGPSSALRRTTLMLTPARMSEWRFRLTETSHDGTAITTSFGGGCEMPEQVPLLRRVATKVGVPAETFRQHGTSLGSNQVNELTLDKEHCGWSTAHDYSDNVELTSEEITRKMEGITRKMQMLTRGEPESELESEPEGWEQEPELEWEAPAEYWVDYGSDTIGQRDGWQPEPQPELEWEAPAEDWMDYESDTDGQRDAGYSSDDSSQDSLTREEKALLLEKPLGEIAPQMVPESQSQLEPEPTFEEKMSQVLHIVYRQQLAELDCKKNAFYTCWMDYISDADGQRDAGYSSDDSSQDSLTREAKALLLELPVEAIAPQMLPVSQSKLEPKPTFEKMSQVLHIVSCKQLAELDPKKNALVPTRFYTFNVAFFDHDEESEVIHGPPIKGLPFSQFRTNVGLSNNVVSVKITKSDVGYPIRVFGTVLARDIVDYKCVYLFRRERDDAQLINSLEDELILTGPRRAFVTPDSLFFEINLKIKGAPGIAEGDFSKGVMEHNTICCDDRAITRRLTSWRSTVELVCTPVVNPVEATLEVKVVKGPRDMPFSSHVIAWTDGYEDNPITLYEYDDSREAAGSCRGLIGNDGSVALDRNLVAVPVSLPCTADEVIEIVLNIGLMDSQGAEEFTHVVVQYPCEEVVGRHGSYELQLKVTWRAVRYNPNHNRCLLMPLPRQTPHSWIWGLRSNAN